MNRDIDLCDQKRKVIKEYSSKIRLTIKKQ